MMFILFLLTCMTTMAAPKYVPQRGMNGKEILPWFLPMSIRSDKGEQLNVLHIGHHPMTDLRPLCVNPYQEEFNLRTILEMACLFSYKTEPSSYRFVSVREFANQKEQFVNEIVDCKKKNGSMSCDIRDAFYDCSYVVQLNCGLCHSHIVLKAGASAEVRSPYYPDLQANSMCIFDIETEVSGDIVVTDLGLQPPVLTENGYRCTNSFLQILNGPSWDSMTSIGNLCGEKRSELKIQQPHLYTRLLYVSGPWVKGLRGFRLSINSPPIASGYKLSGVDIFLITFICLLMISCILCFVGSFIGCNLKKWKTRRQRHQRRGPTAAVGNRVARNQRMIIQRRLAEDNIYVLGQRMTARSAPSQLDLAERPLPTVPGGGSFERSSLGSEDVYEVVHHQHNNELAVSVASYDVSNTSNLQLSQEVNGSSLMLPQLFQGQSSPRSEMMTSLGQEGPNTRREHLSLSLNDGRQISPVFSQGSAGAPLPHRRPLHTLISTSQSPEYCIPAPSVQEVQHASEAIYLELEPKELSDERIGQENPKKENNLALRDMKRPEIRLKLHESLGATVSKDTRSSVTDNMLKPKHKSLSTWMAAGTGLRGLKESVSDNLRNRPSEDGQVLIGVTCVSSDNDSVFSSA